MSVGDFELQETGLKLGDSNGNRFVAVLRNVTGIEDEQLEKLTKSWSKSGFVNYYGHQRFGSSALLKNDYESAVNLILDGRNDADDSFAARQTWTRTKNAHKALAALRRRTCVEADVLSVLAKRKNDFKGAIFALPRNTRNLYAHSYQSLIWNKVVSKRLTELGHSPVPGDLVYCDQGDSDVRSLEADEIEKTSICDVVLPLPSSEMQLPKNAASQWYSELLAEDGLALTDFTAKEKEFALGGSYRNVAVVPKCVKWRLCQYNDVSEKLAPTDADMLQDQVECEPNTKKQKLDSEKCSEVDCVENELGTASVENGKYRALLLSFSLDSGSYATMALRELSRMDFSKQHQSSLNDYSVVEEGAGGDVEESPGDGVSVKA